MIIFYFTGEETEDRDGKKPSQATQLARGGSESQLVLRRMLLTTAKASDIPLFSQNFPKTLGQDMRLRDPASIELAGPPQPSPALARRPYSCGPICGYPVGHRLERNTRAEWFLQQS